MHNGKYLNLLKFTVRLKERLKVSLRDNYLKGNIIYDDNAKEIRIKFLENLHGQLKLMTNDTTFIRQMDLTNVYFRSSEIISSYDYELTFKVIFKNLEYNLIPSSNEQEITGSFLTLMIDLKKKAFN